MEKQHWQDWVSALVGIWLLASPIVLSYFAVGAVPSGAASLNFYVTGLIVAGLGIAALMSFRIWEEVSDVVVGVWLIISPWLLGFTGSPIAMWNSILSGLVVVAAAGWIIFDEQQRV